MTRITTPAGAVIFASPIPGAASRYLDRVRALGFPIHGNVVHGKRDEIVVAVRTNTRRAA